MSELIVTLLRVGYLVVLWLLVLSAVSVLRRDIFGTRVIARGSVLTGSRRSVPDGGANQRSSRASRGAPSTIRVTAGPLRGTTLKLGQSSVLIGRAPSSTLVLDDDYASNRHARIFPEDGQWFVEDLESRNGTYLGAHRVHGPTPVTIGTPIRIGQTVIELHR
ncbi:FHA domain-containing protein FhaB/FipA [Occultella gossypii]|uniref:FHA domain-containing protein n=1 Tax=Occultella gossypii TaxID=2800820 RepID=A0ABS7SBC1_9MICO|nr:FHA domain-containing protein [Occultella gossypii]MBZ2196974.1 FHA domain-containing protein [Occultella gossypii]